MLIHLSFSSSSCRRNDYFFVFFYTWRTHRTKRKTYVQLKGSEGSSLEVFGVDVDGDLSAGMEVKVEWKYDDGNGVSEVRIILSAVNNVWRASLSQSFGQRSLLRNVG